MTEFAKRRNKQWFFDIRKKELQSFAEKVESGRVPNANALEDFVGAMFVVPMLADIGKVLEFLDTFFEVKYRRPLDADETTKASSDFRFDDLRLYGTLRQFDDQPDSALNLIIFEIQVKTFLQHAWSIATHDLVYKFDRVSWARSRVAFQVRAALEHAELTIAAINELETSPIVSKKGEPESGLQALIDLLSAEWDGDVLLENRRRQAENLNDLLRSLKIPTSELKSIIDEGRSQIGGSDPDGWSPYQVTVDYVSRVRPDSLKSVLKRSVRTDKPFVVYVTEEVLRRLELDLATAPTARI